MDTEQRFFYALLSAPRDEQRRFYSRQIPRGIFRLRTAEANWIYRFRETKGHYPSVAIYNSKFSGDKLYKHRDKLDAALQPLLDYAMFTQMKDATLKAKELLDKGEDTVEILRTYKGTVAQIKEFGMDYSDINLSDSSTALSTYRKVVRMAASKSLIDTPWSGVNHMIKYFSPGAAVVFCARTSIGKTWAAICWAHYLASRGIKTLFVSKEMPTEEIDLRMAAMRFRLPYDQLRGAELPLQTYIKWRKDFKAAMEANNYPLIVTGDETISGTGLSSVVSKVEQHEPQVVFLDGAYLFYPEGARKGISQQERFALISNRVKLIAKATKTVFVEILQTNRDAESKDGSTSGGLKDIYGADAWGQDSDAVFILQGKRGSPRRTITLAKSRQSAVGDVNIKFQLDPYPAFTQLGVSSAAPTKQNNTTVEFKGI